MLVLGAGLEPGPEAAAAQLIPALAGLRQPRHILSLPAPGRPQAWRVTVPPPPTPGHRTAASAAGWATVMAASILRGRAGGRGSPKMLQKGAAG